MTTTTVHLAPANLAHALSPREAAAALERVRADAAALSASEVGRVNAHVPTVVAIAMGAQAHFEAFGEQMRRELPYLDHASLAKLPDYARALQYAYLSTLPQGEGETALQAMIGEASPLREKLLVTAEGLALFGLVDRERVAAIRSGGGRLDAANDLMALAQLFRAGGDELVGKTPLSWAEIDRADELGWQLVQALGKRRVGSDGAGAPGEADELCARLFRLLVRTYDEGRRALAYLRWKEGDASELAPSLFAQRRGGRSPSPEAPGGEAPGEPEAPGGAVD